MEVYSSVEEFKSDTLWDLVCPTSIEDSSIRLGSHDRVRPLTWISILGRFGVSLPKGMSLTFYNKQQNSVTQILIKQCVVI